MSNSLALGTLPTLPPNTLPPVVLPFDPTGTLPLGILTVRSQAITRTKPVLKDLARIDVRNMLGGGQGRRSRRWWSAARTGRFWSTSKPKELEARGLSPLDVVDALRHGNLMVTPGACTCGGYEFLLDSNAMVPDVDDVETVSNSSPTQGNVFLEDIGHVEDGSAIQTSRVRSTASRRSMCRSIARGGAAVWRSSDGVKASAADEQARTHRKATAWPADRR